MAYATVADARAEGVPTTILDATIQAQLDRWSSFIDAATKQWFEPRDVEIFLDGNQSRTLFLAVPVIELTSLYINGDFTTACSPDLYVVYSNRTSVRDDRRNPMIKLAGSGLGVFDTPDFRLGMMFAPGVANQKLVGSFGFVEEDESTPPLIKRAVLKLTIRELVGGGGTLWGQLTGSPPGAGGGQIQSETTDGHTISYAAFSVKPTNPGLNGITNDAEVDRIIDLYRAPLKITSTVGSGGPDRRW